MSKLKVLGEAVALDEVAAQAAVDFDATPFSPGFNGVVVFSMTGATGTPTVKVQGSDDGGTTWSDLLVVSSITAFLKLADVTLHAKMRLNVTVDGTAGTVSAYVIE